MTIPQNGLKPFDSDCDYLESAFFPWVAAKVKAVAAEREARFEAKRYTDLADDLRRAFTAGLSKRRLPVSTSAQAEGELAYWLAEAEELGQQIEARLKVHRASSAPRLGIDVVCDKHDLDDNERFILLALAIPAVSEQLSTEIFGELGGVTTTLTVDGLISLLGPEGVEQWLRWRRYFTAESKLVTAGLMQVDSAHCTKQPEDLLPCWVRLTHKGLAEITGIANLADEKLVEEDRRNK